MNLSDILNKSQKYAESLLAENGFYSYILPQVVEGKDNKRVGLIIRSGRVADYKVG